MNDDNETEFHFYNHEEIKDSDIKAQNSKIAGRVKPTIVTTHMCKLFCRGADCKYCKPELKFADDAMVVDGLYSSWVTNNILAMARPSTTNINKFNVIDSFKKLGIKTVINMQKVGEHNYCGHALEEGGFSYDPYIFMTNGIDYLNFPCEDYGVLRVEYLIDITKLMQHHLSRGKIAVHCHAGLGRTGLVIACYLIFNNRFSDIEAINYVREKRPNSIQTSIQVEKIIEFYGYIRPFRYVIWNQDPGLYKFSLQEAVLRQKKLVHGEEAYIVHYIPKVIYLCLRKISQIALEADNTDLFESTESSISSNSDENIVNYSGEHKINPKVLLNFLRWNRKIKQYFNKSLSEHNADSILEYFGKEYENPSQLVNIKNELNSTDETWRKLYQIEDTHLHCAIVMDYLDSLKFPVLRTPDIELLSGEFGGEPLHRLLRLETCVGRTLALFLAFIDQSKCLDSSKRWRLRSIIFSRLTHKNIAFDISDGSSLIHQYDKDLSQCLTDTLRSFLRLT